MWSSWARPVLPRASLASPARWHMVHSIHISRHTVYWVQAQVGFGRVYFPGPNLVGAGAHFMRWAQPILRLSRRACARANDGLASVNAGQPLMKILSHFVKSVLYFSLYWSLDIHITHSSQAERGDRCDASKPLSSRRNVRLLQWQRVNWRRPWLKARSIRGVG